MYIHEFILNIISQSLHFQLGTELFVLTGALLLFYYATSLGASLSVAPRPSVRPSGNSDFIEIGKP